MSLPHRGWLADRLLADAPCELLEVGCGWGPNLETLAKREPALRLTGIDISPASVAEGRQRFDAAGLSHIRLVEGHAGSLGAFADGSVDTVFTDAALLYIGPDKIERSLREMLRIARRRLVVMEMHEFGAGARGRFTQDGWVRDYVALIRGAIGPEARVSVQQLPEGLFPAGRWPEFGALIELDLPRRG